MRARRGGRARGAPGLPGGVAACALVARVAGAAEPPHTVALSTEPRSLVEEILGPTIYPQPFELLFGFYGELSGATPIIDTGALESPALARDVGFEFEAGGSYRYRFRVGWKHVGFWSPERSFSGVHLAPLGIGVAQRVGKNVEIEPSASLLDIERLDGARDDRPSHSAVILGAAAALGARLRPSRAFYCTPTAGFHFRYLSATAPGVTLDSGIDLALRLSCGVVLEREAGGGEKRAMRR